MLKQLSSIMKTTTAKNGNCDKAFGISYFSMLLLGCSCLCVYARASLMKLVYICEMFPNIKIRELKADRCKYASDNLNQYRTQLTVGIQNKMLVSFCLGDISDNRRFLTFDFMPSKNPSCKRQNLVLSGKTLKTHFFTVTTTQWGKR